MFETKSRKTTQRISTSKVLIHPSQLHSQQADKKPQKNNYQSKICTAIYTDTTGLKSHKSKSQHQSKQRIHSHKSIDVKKIIGNNGGVGNGGKQSNFVSGGHHQFIGNNSKNVSKNKSEKYSNNKDIHHNDKNEKEAIFDRISQVKIKKPILYQNIVTEKAAVAQLKWNNGKKVSILKKNQARSVQRNKKQWDQTKVPYNWDVVLTDFSYLLTKFQQSQIKEYKKIYYVGQKAKKREKIDNTLQANFDNEEKQYNFIVNDHIAYRFQILGLIGKGSYGQVFRIYDHKKKEQFALKMIKNRTKFSKQAFIQIQILTHIKQHDPQSISNIIKIKDFVIFRKHVCIVFELLSQNLYQLIIRNNYNGLSLDLVRRFAIQILNALQFLRKNKIIHCDLKPQNILLKQYHKSGIKIVDFGSSCFQHETIYTYIQSRYYRAPQITLGVEYDCKIDMWSAGCILGELYTGVPLFPGENQNQQMKYLVSTLGCPSQEVLKKGSRSNIFFKDGKLKKQLNELKTIEYFTKSLVQRIPDQGFRNFLQLFLKWNPSERAIPIQALKNKWIVEGMPEHLRASQMFAKDQQKSMSSRTVRISSKSISKQKRSKLSLASINTKKTLQHRE